MKSIPSRSTCLSLAGLLLVSVGCGRQDRAPSPGAASLQPFGPFAERVFAELQSRPITDDPAVQIGLFGDLDVMSHEHVVMGRYRYRIDTTDGTPEANMAFLVRAEANDSGTRANGAAPVILTFGEAGGGWQLTRARYVNRPDTPAAIAAALENRLEPWAAAAVQRTSEH